MSKEVYILKDKKHSNLLFCSSFLFFINSIISYTFEIYDYSYLLFCLFLTSINYWRKPTLSLRRNIDIFFAIVSFLYHKYSMLNNIYRYIIPITLLWFGVIFYLTGIFLSKKKNTSFSYMSCVFAYFYKFILCNLYNLFLIFIFNISKY